MFKDNNSILCFTCCLQMCQNGSEEIRRLINAELQRWKPRPTGDPSGEESFVWHGHQFKLLSRVEGSKPDVTCVAFGTERAHSIRLTTRHVEMRVLCLSSCSFPSDFTIIRQRMHSGMCLQSHVGIRRCKTVMTARWTVQRRILFVSAYLLLLLGLPDVKLWLYWCQLWTASSGRSIHPWALTRLAFQLIPTDNLKEIVRSVEVPWLRLALLAAKLTWMTLIRSFVIPYVQVLKGIGLETCFRSLESVVKVLSGSQMLSQ